MTMAEMNQIAGKRDLTPAEYVDQAARQLLQAKKVHVESEERWRAAQAEWRDRLSSFMTWLEAIEPTTAAEVPPNPAYPGGAVSGCAWE